MKVRYDVNSEDAIFNLLTEHKLVIDIRLGEDPLVPHYRCGSCTGLFRVFGHNCRPGALHRQSSTGEWYAVCERCTFVEEVNPLR